ncbi:MAG: acyl carrier protein [Myxococcota bacterium]|nr:acyl carrier protein [Myxococcota bacterium]
MSIENLVMQLIQRHGRGSEGRVVSMAMPLDELGVDVLRLAQVVSIIEGRFGVEFDASEALTWMTGQDIVSGVAHVLQTRHSLGS